MLVPLRNQRPLRPVFLHWQDPPGSLQPLQTRPLGVWTAGALRPIRSAAAVFIAVAARVASPNPPLRMAGFLAPPAGRPSANFPTNPAGHGFRLRVSFAESARTLCATATGVSSLGAIYAALVAFPANRTNTRYFSNNLRHFSKSGSVAVSPATLACNA